MWGWALLPLISLASAQDIGNVNIDNSLLDSMRGLISVRTSVPLTPTDEDVCLTPERTQGSCKKLTQCPPYLHLSNQLDRPGVLTFFRQRLCNVTEQFVTICCPDLDLNDNGARRVTSAAQTPPRHNLRPPGTTTTTATTTTTTRAPIRPTIPQRHNSRRPSGAGANRQNPPLLLPPQILPRPTQQPSLPQTPPQIPPSQPLPPPLQPQPLPSFPSSQGRPQPQIPPQPSQPLQPQPPPREPESQPQLPPTSRPLPPQVPPPQPLIPSQPQLPPSRPQLPPPSRPQGDGPRPQPPLLRPPPTRPQQRPPQLPPSPQQPPRSKPPNLQPPSLRPQPSDTLPSQNQPLLPPSSQPTFPQSQPQQPPLPQPPLPQPQQPPLPQPQPPLPQPPIQQPPLPTNTTKSNVIPEETQCGELPEGFREGDPWPWLVRVFEGNNGESSGGCVGTIITSIHVLVPAHCITDIQTVFVLVGNDVIGVKNVEAAVGYDSTTRSNDIAIITLQLPQLPLQFTDKLQPVCLPFRFEFDGFRYQTLQQINYVHSGSVNNGGFAESVMEVVGEGQCRDVIASSLPVNRKHICATPVTTTQNANFVHNCEDHSGSSLLYLDTETTGRYFLIGLASLSPCTQSHSLSAIPQPSPHLNNSTPFQDQPSEAPRKDPRQSPLVLYTRIGAYLDWVKESVK